eukprot:m.87988 g.87988  ORF g.87988 m.87988 type:complete len:188 (-) comp8798_c2_seq1:1534-2097(-)
MQSEQERELYVPPSSSGHENISTPNDVSSSSSMLSTPLPLHHPHSTPLFLSPSNHLACEQEIRRIADAMIAYCVWDVAFEVHRSNKKGLVCFCGADPNHKHNNGMVIGFGVDVFGNCILKDNAPNVICPNCKMARHASKFAPHLEKCMGIGGRESRRIAINRTKAQLSNNSNRDSNSQNAKKAKRNG